jgi:thiosulfate reductase cytochrome b subunit
MQTNPYEPPASSQMEVGTGAMNDNNACDRRSVAVRILAVFGIVFVVTYESYHAVTQSIQWRDWVHFVVAGGTMCFLIAACRNGHWRIRNSNNVSSASSEPHS